ncbi:MAG: putative Peptidylprolyl isomerase [Candidatus Saccharibacteria bacterium]|nr:putative Peptidylprolyl isomerase [Candidatus Saccharibacteria bacterium]
MATPKAQRIAIWIIAIVMTVGTIGSFLVIILGNKNTQTDQQRINELSTAYQKEYAAYQAKVDKQSKELSDKYYTEFSSYSTRPSAFDGSAVKDLATTDLKVGDGEDIKADTAYSAYYIGWNPSGKVFDQSIDNGTLKAPIEGGNLIEGWNKGVIGMKVGGVREITIPSAQAYGEAGSGTDIPPNTPIKFVVMIIPKPEKLSAPEPSAELLRYYYGQQ